MKGTIPNGEGKREVERRRKREEERETQRGERVRKEHCPKG